MREKIIGQQEGKGVASHRCSMPIQNDKSSLHKIQIQIELYERLLLLGNFSEVSEGVGLLVPQLYNHVNVTEQCKLLEIRLLFITIQAFIGCQRVEDLKELLLSTLGLLMNVPCKAFILWQLLLVDAGHARDAKVLLEQRLEQLLSPPASISHHSENVSMKNNPTFPSQLQQQHLREVDEKLEVDIKACSTCYVIDVLCDGLKDYDTAEHWLKNQQDITGRDQHSGVEHEPVSSLSKRYLSASEVKGLLSKVEAKKGVDATRKPASPFPPEMKPLPLATASATEVGVSMKSDPSVAGGSISRAGDDVSNASLKSVMMSALLQQPSAIMGGSGFFTMMGDIPLQHEEDPIAKVSDTLRQGSTGVSPLLIQGSSKKQYSSSLSAVVIRLIHLFTSRTRSFGFFFFDQMRRGIAVDGGGYQAWKSALLALVSCALTLALVIESKTIASATKAWWRQLRLALRLLMHELLSMGLTLNLNPIRNGYSPVSSR
ncbi:hypothetical protein CEUSTIGMA_g3965.t1 [Chlamydomonas eustigma]|uniref:Uncharacterized protein n=1 Tax=Chlamydomonas eustigma TaxID=1157962 RepID=A0A250X0R5_9CHLO|nr:hypothetical protein CEUSTIGMA_g3965.t1 [Chlamydomonas eustigma]|eukprot:GAX76519.1 hypothetical protein CEUSTIGMA_g3965.t1 [Chlamydomonas eustigma]